MTALKVEPKAILKTLALAAYSATIARYQLQRDVILEPPWSTH
jgi:hypothetical protein